MHVKHLDLIATLVSAVEKSVGAAGTQTPVPNLSTLFSISHYTDWATVAFVRTNRIKGIVFVHALKAYCGMKYSSIL